MGQCELEANARSLRQARENARDQVAIDWLSMWREIFKPIKERSKAKPKQFGITLQRSIIHAQSVDPTREQSKNSILEKLSKHSERFMEPCTFKLWRHFWWRVQNHGLHETSKI